MPMQARTLTLLSRSWATGGCTLCIPTAPCPRQRMTTWVLATTEYGGSFISVHPEGRNINATQFHPERRVRGAAGPGHHSVFPGGA